MAIVNNKTEKLDYTVGLLKKTTEYVGIHFKTNTIVWKTERNILLWNTIQTLQLICVADFVT